MFGKKIYSILNVYESTSDGLLFEAVLRWGDVEGTSCNGGTLRYPLGMKINACTKGEKCHTKLKNSLL